MAGWKLARPRADSASWRRLKVAALERSDNVADSDHAFAVLKRSYTRRRTTVKTTSAVTAVSSSPVSRATTRR